MSYDRIRWPCYKDVIYRKKHQTFLPNDQFGVKGMLGLKPPKESKSSLTPNQLTFDCEFECGNIDLPPHGFAVQALNIHNVPAHHFPTPLH